MNVLLADALRTYDEYLGASPSTFEVPTGSGNRLTLAEAADLLDARLIDLFRVGPDGRRPSDGAADRGDRRRPCGAITLTFSEYFHGDTGEGLGATHQTGWTALVAHLICRRRCGPVARQRSSAGQTERATVWIRRAPAGTERR